MRAQPAAKADLIRSLLALPEQSLRVGWLTDKIHGGSLHLYADALDAVCGAAQTGDGAAREALLSIALFLVGQRDSNLIWALRERAKAEALLDIERLIRANPDEGEVGYERDVPVPDYGRGRELTVGERRSMARRPTRLQLERLLRDPHPLVIAQLLQCPSLTEADVLHVIVQRPVRLVALNAVAVEFRWLKRRDVRRALILNPGTPHGIAMPLVCACPRDDLISIRAATTVSGTLRAVAHELLSRLPPVLSSEPLIQ